MFYVDFTELSLIITKYSLLSRAPQFHEALDAELQRRQALSHYGSQKLKF